MKSVFKAAVLIILLCSMASASAGEKEGLEALRQTTLNLIRLLVQEGVLTPEKAEELIRKAQAPSPAAPVATEEPKAQPNVVRVPYVPEFVRNEIKEELRQEVLAQAKGERWGEPGALPEWLSRFKFDGDLRLRFEDDIFGLNNAPALNFQATNTNRSLTLLNTTQERPRFRLRGRLGVNASVNDDLSALFRVVTGNNVDPVSENQTLGNTFNRFSISLDRVYLDYHPNAWFNAQGGRIPNPWFSTDLMWAPDLGFDGFTATVKPKLSEEAGLFLTAGAFPVQEVELSSHDKWLYGTQGGLEFNFPEAFGFKLGAAYYHYTNIVGQVSPPGSNAFEFTAPAFVQKGNTLFFISSDPTKPLFGFASDYHLLNITSQLDISVFSPFHAILTGDYVKNLGFDRGAVSQRVGQDVEPQIEGYSVRLTLGSPEIKRRHDWQTFVGYKRVERDALLDAFTDPDFHLGGTNAKGYVVGGSYGLAANTWLTLKWLSADQISGPPLAIDVLQFDLNAKF